MPEQDFGRPTGLALKLERTAARAKAQDVAREMGVTPARIGQIEALAIVTTETATRYREALARLRQAVA